MFAREGLRASAGLDIQDQRHTVLPEDSLNKIKQSGHQTRVQCDECVEWLILNRQSIWSIDCRASPPSVAPASKNRETEPFALKKLSTVLLSV